MGCDLSHFRLMHRLLAGSEEMVLVLEDDFRVPDGAAPLLPALLARLAATPRGWDVLHLRLCDATLQGAVGEGVRLFSRGFCTLGMLYTRAAALKVRSLAAIQGRFCLVAVFGGPGGRWEGSPRRAAVGCGFGHDSAWFAPRGFVGRGASPSAAQVERWDGEGLSPSCTCSIAAGVSPTRDAVQPSTRRPSPPPLPHTHTRARRSLPRHHQVLRAAEVGMRNVDNLLLDLALTGQLSAYVADPPLVEPLPAADWPSLIDRDAGEVKDPF